MNRYEAVGGRFWVGVVVAILLAGPFWVGVYLILTFIFGWL